MGAIRVVGQGRAPGTIKAVITWLCFVQLTLNVVLQATPCDPPIFRNGCTSQPAQQGRAVAGRAIGLISLLVWADGGQGFTHRGTRRPSGSALDIQGLFQASAQISDQRVGCGVTNGPGEAAVEHNQQSVRLVVAQYLLLEPLH